VQRFVRPLFSSPLIRRVGWHLSRVRSSIDRRFFALLLIGAFTVVLIVASLITIVEKPLTFSSLGASVNGRVQTILGPGDSSYVTSPSTASMSGPARSSRGGISHLMRGATTVG
jgi:voltage-gated potassium channel